MQTSARGGPQRAGNRRKFVQEDERLRRHSAEAQWSAPL